MTEIAHLKKGGLQSRAVRKWTLYNTWMRLTTTAQRVDFLGFTGMDSAPWSDADFPATTNSVRGFMWWLALPAVELIPTASGPRGHSFTYVCSITYRLLSFLEDEEELSPVKGLFAASDLSLLRKEQADVMNSIAL